MVSSAASMFRVPCRIFAAIAVLVAAHAFGQEQQRPRAAGSNHDNAPLGGKENEAWLRKLIHDTIAPQPRKRVANAKVNALLPWSQAVGGLTARIECVNLGGYAGFTVLVRLKNVSHKPLSVPTGYSLGERGVFELLTQPFSGPWTQTDWGIAKEADALLRHNAHEDRTVLNGLFESYQIRAGNGFERPIVSLAPGESCLAYLCGNEEAPALRDALKAAAQIKIILRRPKAAEKGGWTGVLESPPSPVYASEESRNVLTGSLSCPEYLPELTLSRTQLANGFGDEPDVLLLSVSNSVLLHTLRLYEPAGVRRQFERWMLAEHDPPMKLLLAAVAARAGSEPAALFLLESMKSTKYHDFMNVQAVLRFALAIDESDPPDWIVALAETALTDDRNADMRGTNISSGDGTPLKISFFANEDNDLAISLGYTRSRKVVPFLIEMVKQTKGQRMPVMALGAAHDPRSIPVLIECLERAGKTAEYERGIGLPDEFSRPVYSLAELKAKEAVPALLKFVKFSEVIEALGTIGDPRALPAMRELVKSKGKIIKNGEVVPSSYDQERWFAARLAEAALAGDVVPTLCAMVGDRTLDQYQRRTAVWRLGDRKDPRAIAVLVRAIKSDPSGAVVNQAISVLSVFKNKAAVEGLIDCFDADFKGKNDWKRAYKPEMYQENIAESLRAITEESIGPDKNQWQAWWREQAPKSSLK